MIDDVVDEGPIVVLTELAAEKFKRVCEDEGFTYEMRLGIQGGGCAGFQYALDFEQAFRDEKLKSIKDEEELNKLLGLYKEQFVSEQHGIKIYIDPMSAAHLEGTTLDYVMSLMGAGFKFKNPNTNNTCGCGSSFS